MHQYGYFVLFLLFVSIALTTIDGTTTVNELSVEDRMLKKRDLQTTSDHDSALLPEVLKWKKNVILENELRFDPSVCGSGLYISDENLQLRQVANADRFRSCRLMNAGWSSGIHYWSFRLVDLGASSLVLGVVTDEFDISAETYPGSSSNNYGLYTSNGSKYTNGGSFQFAPDNLYQNNDEAGILLDLEARTITFFKNGRMMGTAFSNIAPGSNMTKYYPAVGLYHLGHWINIIKTI
ncbi:hypothetical protein I4U23_000178 [Adineta vaga]|nr:hypothetical protein I4U23_000178 [Adineta vaga]